MGNANKLAILIPTRNRAKYLKELLDTLMPQTVNCQVVVYIRDNCSSDDTMEVVEGFSSVYSNIIYTKNNMNFGATVNFLMLINDCREEYFWLFGDDELFCKNGLEYVIKSLEDSPSSVILTDYAKQGTVYGTFSEFIAFYLKNNPFFLIANTLITCNIMKRSLFNMELAQSKYATSYAQMYGISGGLARSKAQNIRVVPNKAFVVRKERAKAVDNDWHVCLEREWTAYLRFVARECAVDFPWLKVLLINAKRKLRYAFGKFVSFIVGPKIKELIRRNILSR